MRKVVCGAGVMGCATAYNLALRGVPSVVVEQQGIACASSGHAGGFLARDMCDDSAVGPLARASFDMHMGYAETFSGLGYRRLGCLELLLADKAEDADVGIALPKWVDAPIQKMSVLGTPDNTAQVDPHILCLALLEAARTLTSVDVICGRVEGIELGENRVSGVHVLVADGTRTTLATDAVAITMGPWSGRALQWLGLEPLVSAKRAHGIIVRPPPELASSLSAHAVFSDVQMPNGTVECAEIYPRPNGTVYLSDDGWSQSIPDSQMEVGVDLDISHDIRALASRASSVIAASHVEHISACLMPTTVDDLPLIGELPGRSGVFLASGHGMWGILNGPGTGRALADLMTDGGCAWLDLTPFDPRRLLS